MSHGDHVSRLPEGFQLAAKSDNGLIASAFDAKRKFYLVQFHPEVHGSVYGREILQNFLFRVCQVKADWTMESYIDMQVQNIREQVGDQKVLCGLSGGVDSTVAAVLIHRAIGDQLTCMFIDHGLLRKDEGDQVMGVLSFMEL